MIALYHGVSAISRLIRFRTWSEYSHAAYLHSDLSVTEAWTSGVRRASHFATQHTPGTRVDLFEVDISAGERDGIEGFLAAQVGKKYDFRGVAGFITRRDKAQNQDRWFCSELVFAAFAHVHHPLLLRIEPWRVAPGDLALSPLLIYHSSVTCEPRGRVYAEANPVAVGARRFAV